MLRTIAKCQCRGCGRYFVGPSIFEKHRVGFRCMTRRQMQEVGLKCERRPVRLMRENKSYTELHEVWYAESNRRALAEFRGRLFGKKVPT